MSAAAALPSCSPPQVALSCAPARAALWRRCWSPARHPEACSSAAGGQAAALQLAARRSRGPLEQRPAAAPHAARPRRLAARRSSVARPPRAAKLFVPDDTFGGRSPELRASQSLTNLITAVAIRIVLSQLGPGGEGGDLPPAPQYFYLREYLDERPLAGDPEDWLAELMARESGQMLGVRIMEVREAYCTELDWEQLKTLTERGIREGNVALMRQHAARAFGGSLGPDPPAPPTKGGS